MSKIIAPDPDACRSSRYFSDLQFREAADVAHSLAQRWNPTLHHLRVPCTFVPDDDAWQGSYLLKLIEEDY